MHTVMFIALSMIGGLFTTIGSGADIIVKYASASSMSIELTKNLFMVRKTTA